MNIRTVFMAGFAAMFFVGLVAHDNYWLIALGLIGFGCSWKIPASWRI